MMKATLIDGRQIADEIRGELVQEIAELKRHHIVPGLATVLVGDNPASETYVRMKKKACEQLGMLTKSIYRPNNIDQQELIEIIDSLSKDDEIHGILVQLPLPSHIDEQEIIRAIPMEKDVDGFHPYNLGNLMLDQSGFVPCTPAGIQEMLIRSGFSPEKKHVVILGRSHIVGLPLANLLMKKNERANATVTICHTGTKDLAHHCREADILIAAMGRPEFVTADMVKADAVVIDVGTNRVEDAQSKTGYRLVGDVHFASVSEKVRAISPVPGGVGPMTIIMLMKNTVRSAQLFHSRQ